MYTARYEVILIGVPPREGPPGAVRSKLPRPWVAVIGCLRILAGATLGGLVTNGAVGVARSQAVLTVSVSASCCKASECIFTEIQRRQYAGKRPYNNEDRSGDDPKRR